MMHRRASIYLLLLVMAGVFFNHVSLRHEDNGYLLVIDEREIDIIGLAHERWVRLRRNCEGVSSLGAESPQHERVKQLIQAYSPPSSASAQITSLVSTQAWALAEVEFKELLPAVVLIKFSEGEPSIVPHAIWSGYTSPWRAAPHVRAYMATQAPQAPAELLDCFEPRSKAFSQ